MRRSTARAALVAWLFGLGCGGGVAAETTPRLGHVEQGSPGNAAPSVGLRFDDTVPPPVRALAERGFRLAIEARHLSPTAPVSLRVLAPAALVDVVRAQVAEDLPRETVRLEGEAMRALGLVPDGYDYEADTFSLLEEQLYGLYSAKDQTMYVSSSVDEPNDVLETLCHELTHSLQEQHFALSKSLKWAPGKGDRLAAYDGLAEGDATSAMVDALILSMRRRGGDLAMVRARDATDLPDHSAEQALDEKLDEARRSGKPSRIARAPRAVALDLLWPYTDGQRFVNALRRRGGWDAVDAVWRSPPQSSEQVLHVEKYLAHEAPIDVEAPTARALGPGWTLGFYDSSGEIGVRIAFDEWMAREVAASAAAGWSGDMLALYASPRGEYAVSWKIVYDDDVHAVDAFTALSTTWSARYGTPSAASFGEGGKRSAVAFGVSLAASKSGKASAASKPPPAEKKRAGAPELPPLPSRTAAPKKPAPTCRGLVREGKMVALFASAPCDRLAAWMQEVAP